jgi:hypothetical protein
MDEPTMDADELAERLAEVRRLQALARQSLLTSGWAILVLWGALFIVSVPMAFLLDGDVGLYWGIGAVGGAVASFFIGARAEVLPRRAAWTYATTSAAMFVGAFGAFWVFEEVLAILVWFCVLTVGFGVFTALDEQWHVLAGLGALFAWGIAMYAVAPDQGTLYAALAGALGATLIGVGTAFRTVRA